jgi:exosortase
MTIITHGNPPRTGGAPAFFGRTDLSFAITLETSTRLPAGRRMVASGFSRPAARLLPKWMRSNRDGTDNSGCYYKIELIMSTAVAGDNNRRIPAASWIVMGWAAALIVLCYYPVIVRLVRQWANDDDMGHGFFVPVIAAWIAWQKLDEARSVPAVPDWRGLILLAWAALQLCIATLGAELFLARSALVFTIIGTVWLLGGIRYLRVFAFPLFLLFFMIPIPAIIYTRITFPLQLFASAVAETMLNLLGIAVGREGNVLELSTMKLDVVEACSGIRSLLSLTFLSLVYGYFFESNRTIRTILFFSTIPIAILANAGRVTITGILAEVKPEWAEGAAHEAEGWLIFMVALAIMVVVHQVLTRFWSYTRRRR